VSELLSAWFSRSFHEGMSAWGRKGQTALVRTCTEGLTDAYQHPEAAALQQTLEHGQRIAIVLQK